MESTRFEPAEPASSTGSEINLSRTTGALPRARPEEYAAKNNATDGGGRQLAEALGWFSLGLGIASIAAPGAVARLIGVRDEESNRNLLRFVGLREIASGIGILAQPAAPGGVWSRVVGDVMDLTLLGSALGSEQSNRGRVAATTAMVAGVAAVDLMAGKKLAASEGEDRCITLVKVTTINRSAEELYGFWRDFRNLPRFMNHLESVEILDDRRSRWQTKGPAGRSVAWTAEVVDDRPNQFISWRSLPGSDVETSGWVRFDPAPGDRGTEVRVELRYLPPAGMLGATIARLFGREPGQELKEDLRTFKQVMETGELVRSGASLHGATFPQQPAQPPEMRMAA